VASKEMIPQLGKMKIGLGWMIWDSLFLMEVAILKPRG